MASFFMEVHIIPECILEESKFFGKLDLVRLEPGGSVWA